VIAPQPIVVVTSWGGAGVAPLAVLIAAASITGIAYWQILRRLQTLSLTTIVLASAAGLAVASLAPVLFSSDVYAYAAYGEMVRIGLNPYVRAPIDSPDILVRAAHAQWISAFPICVYGAAFVGLARAIVTVLAPLGVLAQLNAFRATAAAALLLCIVLAYGAYRGDSATRLRAAATIGLNPVVIWCAAEGHNDALALAIVLCGFALARHRFVQAGAAVVALSALVKPPGVLAVGALAVANPRARMGAAVGLGIAAFFSVPLIEGVATQLAPHGRYAPQASVQAIFAPLGPIAAFAIAAALAIALFVAGIRLLRCGRDEGWIWLGLAAWSLVPNPYPWYAIWLVAPAAMAPRSREACVAVLLSFTSLLRYVPDAIATPTGPLAVALAVAAALPLAGLVPLRRWYNQQLA
jgi:alpha-1,6-mannosyltransferase